MEFDDFFRASDVSRNEFSEIESLQSENVVVESFPSDPVLGFYDLREHMRAAASTLQRPQDWRFRVAVVMPRDPEVAGWTRVIQQINSREFVGVHCTPDGERRHHPVIGSERIMNTEQISYLSKKWESTLQLIMARSGESGVQSLNRFDGSDRLVDILTVTKPLLDAKAREAQRRSFGSRFLRKP